MTKYHQESIARKMASIDCWKKQPLKPEEYRTRKSYLTRGGTRGDHALLRTMLLYGLDESMRLGFAALS